MEIAEDWQTANKRHITFTDYPAYEGGPKLQNKCCSISGDGVANSGLQDDGLLFQFALPRSF